MTTPTVAHATTAPQADPPNAMRLILTVGTTIGLAIMGDSLLYSILPLAAPGLGITLPQVGVLLSANRLIRLLSNTWASGFYERLGPRVPFIGAALLGVCATVAYGMGWGFATLLAARIIWGIGWSALRQGGYQAVWGAGDQVRGRMTGILWGLVRLGSAIGVMGGGYLYDQFGYGTAIGAVIVMAVAAVPVAALIRWPVEGKAVSSKGIRPATTSQATTPSIARHRIDLQLRNLGYGWLSVLDTSARRWLVGATFCDLLLNSVVVATTSLFLVSKLGNEQNALTLGIGIATVTGVLHGVRWLTDLTIGPALGYLSDRWGQPLMALILVFILFSALSGAIAAPGLYAVLCLLLAFLCKGGLYVVLSAAATGAATRTPRPHLFMSTYATASDAGSAIGPLFAFSIGNWIGLPVLYVGLGAILVIVLVQYRRYAAPFHLA